MESERKIEKLLRAYAKKRREQAGAPLELHPATRRLLQSEVARRAPKPDDGNFFSRFVAVLRPRWAIVGAGAAAVVLAVALLWPSLQKTKSDSSLASVRSDDLSKVDQLKEQPAIAPPATVPVARTPPAQPQTLEPAAGETFKDKSGDAANRARTAGTDMKLEVATADRMQFDEQVKTAAAPDVRGFGGIAGSASAPTIARADRSAKPEGTVTGAMQPAISAGDLPVATAEPAEKKLQFGASATPAAKAPTVALGGRGGGGGAGATEAAGVRYSTAVREEELPATNTVLTRGQRFVQARAASATPASPSNIIPVLASFAVEQNGRALRVVDSDGSTYDGFVQLGGAPASSAVAPQRKFQQTLDAVAKDSGAKPAGAEAAWNYSFRVAGTNRSLKQNVVFSGNLSAMTNALPFSSASNVGTLGAGQLPGASPAVEPLLLQHSRINGTILIDNTRQIQIEATPAPASPQR